MAPDTDQATRVDIAIIGAGFSGLGTAIYLASAASDYVSGQIIYVDGGMLAVL